MPIYGYICRSCEHTLDALQKMSDDPLVYCPDCGEPQLKRQLSAPRFRLKGEGWYETDFKNVNKRNLAGDKEADSGKDEAGDKKDAKDARTADKKPDATASTSSGDKSPAA